MKRRPVAVLLASVMALSLAGPAAAADPLVEVTIDPTGTLSPEGAIISGTLQCAPGAPPFSIVVDLRQKVGQRVIEEFEDLDFVFVCDGTVHSWVAVMLGSRVEPGTGNSLYKAGPAVVRIGVSDGFDEVLASAQRTIKLRRAHP